MYTTAVQSLTLVCYSFYLISPYTMFNLVPYSMQVQEPEAFNWKCMICLHLAQSPLHLEMQWIVEHGPHLDLDGVTKWIKCSKCLSPYCVQWLPNAPEIVTGDFVCTFFSCKQ